MPRRWSSASARQGQVRGNAGRTARAHAEGREFSLGSGFTDEQRRNPPPLGSTVTYRYRDLTGNGFAAFPQLLATENGVTLRLHLTKVRLAAKWCAAV
jgi:hypothetical protein